MPYAVVNEEGGFTDNATKNISLIDRIEDITLPALDDVRDSLMDYRGEVERAEELDEKIRETDERIDELVYELYDLTDDEIDIVEENVK